MIFFDQESRENKVNLTSEQPVDSEFFQEIASANSNEIVELDHLATLYSPDFVISDPDDCRPKLYVNGKLHPSIFDDEKSALIPTAPLGNGQFEIAYTLTDVAGDESELSPAIHIKIEQDNYVLVKQASIDESKQDETNIARPDFTIEPALGRTPELYIDGVKVAASFNVEQNLLTPMESLTAGRHAICYKLIDTAGFATPMSKPLIIIVNLNANNFRFNSEALSKVDYDLTYVSNNMTGDLRPNFLVMPAGNKIPSLYVDGLKVSASYDAENHTLAPDEPLAEGLRKIAYSFTDASGKESAPSSALTIEVNAKFSQLMESLGAEVANAKGLQEHLFGASKVSVKAAKKTSVEATK